jgi:hypothetical protein
VTLAQTSTDRSMLIERVADRGPGVDFSYRRVTDSSYLR